MIEVVDCAIVGAGVAGMSAALFLGRADRSLVVFDGGQSRIQCVDEIREHLGFDGIPTGEFLGRMRQELARYGVDIRAESVSTVETLENGLFAVSTASSRITARTVVLATGLIDILPPLSGLPKAWGRDVRVCPCFDGYEVRGKRFVVFGLPLRLAHLASWVSMWSTDVTVVTQHTFSEADCERLALLNIKVIPDEVTGLVHRDEKLVGVSLESGDEFQCDATWIATNMKAASELAASLCDVDELGLARTDKLGQTSRPGIFAIGNANDQLAHIAHASAAGTTVGPMVNFYLLEHRIAELRKAKAGADRTAQYH